MKKPLISIITVNYNQPEVTAALLESLKLLDYDQWEMIVVDNASPKYNSAYLKKQYPYIKHIACPENLGFAGGNNVGLQYATGEYAFFINNDTEVTANLLSNLVNYMQAHPECGMACPKIKYHHTPDTIQYAGAVGLHPLTSRSYDIGYLEKDNGQFNDTRKTDLPMGAAMLVPMALIQKVGPMSEMFFLYYEELDWGARIKHAGYEIHYVGTTEVYHKESLSTGKNSVLKTFYLFRNRLLFIRRNYQHIRWLIAASFFVFISTPVHFVRHLMKKEWGHSKAIVRALFWNLTNKPYIEPQVNSDSIKPRLIADL
jgi:GT2 family glycosyltransferase